MKTPPGSTRRGNEVSAKRLLTPCPMTCRFRKIRKDEKNDTFSFRREALYFAVIGSSPTCLMTYEEKIQSSMRLHEYVRNWRGQLINSVSVIDLQLALIISKFFAKEERFLLFFSEVATSQSMTFSKKREMMRIIFQQDPLLETDKDRNLLKELQEIGTFRNILAHSVLDVSEEALLISA
jgi:hypothetical protein